MNSLALCRRVMFLINVKHDRSTEADSCNERIIRGAVFVWHDALARLILVHQDVVWGPMWCFVENTQCGEPWLNDGRYQPFRQRRGEKCVVISQW